jgi:hypothetical protein
MMSPAFSGDGAENVTDVIFIVCASTGANEAMRTTKMSVKYRLNLANIQNPPWEMAGRFFAPSSATPNSHLMH